ncbi:hypothetical protein BHM03_00050747 [Ensete ventricosum]|nr:hypothetical protein BHM03_00050747 [Ensete ventricosum]
MKSCAESLACGDVGLVPSEGSETDRTERSSGEELAGLRIREANSGTNRGDLVERANSGTNPGDLAERANSGTNRGDLAERTNSGTNRGDLAESISGRVVGSRSINDQKNLDGLSPVKNAWMARDRWRSGIPWTCDVNRPTNYERGSSVPWAIPRREAMVGFGRALAKKFSSNSFANKSNKDIDTCLRREYHILAGPLRVVEKARHISASEVS